jgi:phage shock protein C
MAKKLYRSTHEDKHIAAGVFEGMGEWLGVQPGILRVGFIVLALLSGVIPAVLIYFATVFLLEEKPKHSVIDID